ncbi:Transmembrane domain-containing protein [Spironucleus salmonicida]|uniref:Transmembrane domain-containing protein n=1 Tax=Spironucleus salmonicida TaxID=348837 RepID=V6M0N1_9EUKA|nr:Transmembrane domain-containing protein [Spironucleus salmonicida]|eukprot:EST49611.1 Transmembrane domain-containing protein [Spironucleus salmonicida]
MRLSLNQLSIVHASVIVAPPQFIYLLITSYLSSHSAYVSQYFSISQELIQITDKISLCFLAAIAAVSCDFHAHFGMQRCYLGCAVLMELALLLTLAIPNRFSFILFRVSSSFWYGILTPATSSMTNQIVVEGGFSLSVTITTSFTILAGGLGGIITQKSIIIIIVFNIFGLIQLCYAFVVCPLPSPVESKKVIAWSLITLGFISVFSLCLGCVGSVIYQQYWISLILVFSGIGGYFLMFSVNYFVNDKFMFNECYNFNTICFQYGWLVIDCFIFPLVAIIKKEDNLMEITKISLFVLYLTFYFIIKNVTILEVMKFSCYLEVLFLVIFIILLAVNQESSNIAIPFYILQQQQYLAIAIYNTVGTPPPYGPYSSAFVSSQNKLAAVISEGILQIPVSYRYYICLGGIIFGFLIISQIGVFGWEEGKLFFSWKKARKMKTYEILKDQQNGPYQQVIAPQMVIEVAQ